MPAEIKYQKTADGLIRIKEFIGFLSEEELEEKYGEEVTRIYLAGENHMFYVAKSNLGSGGPRILGENHTMSVAVVLGSLLPEKEFYDQVSWMMDCANALSKVRIMVGSKDWSTIHTVEIG